MKKLLVLVATLTGAAIVQQRVAKGQAEQRLWAEATDAGTPSRCAADCSSAPSSMEEQYSPVAESVA